ncbi:MAG: hypothetical protein ACLRWP_10565 [Bilophila wadsworthia]
MVQGLVRYPGAGCVVEFMQARAPDRMGAGEQNGRLRLLLRTAGKRPASRAHPAVARPGLRKELLPRRGAGNLERHKSRREVANVDPLELWELAQGEVEQARPSGSRNSP